MLEFLWDSDEFWEKVFVDLKRQFGKEITNHRLNWFLGYDFLFVQLIITPLFVVAWRGAWENCDTLFDEIICNGDLKLSAVLCLASGIVVSFPLILFQFEISNFALKKGRLGFLIISRTFTIIRFHFDLILWKGIWGLFDYIVGTTWYLSLACIFSASAFLMACQSFKATLGTPIGIKVDRPSTYISVPTALETTNANTYPMRLLDASVTIFLGLVAITSFYGVWTSEDYYWDIFNTTDPTQLARDSAKGAGFGYMCVVVAFFLQFLSLMLHSTSTELKPTKDWRLQDYANYVAYEAILIISLAGNVSVFRGLWGILDIYFIPNRLTLSRCLCQVGGIFFMFFLYTGSTLHAGVVREKHMQKNGILTSHFFLTYLLSNSVPPTDEALSEKNGTAREITDVE